MLSTKILKINTIMIDPDTNDFLSDIANLSDDLKHTEKPSNIDNVSIDDLIEDIPQTEIETNEPKEQTQLEVVEAKELTVQEQQPSTEPAKTEDPTEIQNYILSQCQDIIRQGKETLEQLQDTVVNTCDGKAINGYATLVASLGKVLDTANSIGMEKSRIKSSVELENLKHAHKTQIKSSEKPSITNNAVFVAGREEIIKMLNAQAKESPVTE